MRLFLLLLLLVVASMFAQDAGELWVKFPPKCISKVEGTLECPAKDGTADCKDKRARFTGANITFNSGCAEATSFVKRGN